MSDVQLVWRTFQELDTRTLYALLQLRQAILVVEQVSAYADLDGRDVDARHLIAVDRAGMLVGYARLFGPRYRDADGTNSTAFGRVVVTPEHRKHGLGRQLIGECMRVLDKESPKHPVRISAQTYLETLYEEFGFARDSDPYDDCGVLHIDMVRASRG